jgi:phage shock protein PspC (stress-responsive transcriptional regulator)
MNETLNDPGQTSGPAPQQSPPHQDLDRLRRSTSNRYIAGVAGGLGRHFNLDPTIIRVLLVVLTFFGGAGLLVYAACWLFVPEDNAEHAVIHVGSEPRKILLLAAAGIALLLAAGDAFSGFGSTHWWPVATIAVIVALVLIVRDRRHGGPESGGPSSPTTPPGAAYAPPTYAPPAYAAPTSYARPGSTEQTAVLAPTSAQPPWQPPIARPPLVPPHPKRTGIIWFWPTLALIAIGLGTLGVYDNSHHVVDGAYPALALAITAVMLLVGSVVGRPGGLILIAFVSAIALAGNVAVGGRFGFDAQQIRERPATAAQVQDDYHTTVGDIRLNLTGVADPAALAGRQLHLHLRTGSIVVVVPRSLNVHVDAKLAGAGGIRVPGNDGGGFNHAVDTNLVGAPATTTAPLELDLDAKFGQITVEYR